MKSHPEYNKWMCAHIDITVTIKSLHQFHSLSYPLTMSKEPDMLQQPKQQTLVMTLVILPVVHNVLFFHNEALKG